MKENKLAIIRSSYSPLRTKSYNVQEIGLAIGLTKNNVSTDIYSRFCDIDKETTYYSGHGCIVRLIPIKGYAIFGRVTIFPGLLKRIKQGRYDIVQIHEDSQLITPFIIKSCKEQKIKTILYQGLYKEYNGINRIYQKTFDLLLKNKIINNVDLIFAKTSFAKRYLEKKGYSNIEEVPIGLNFTTDKVVCKYKKEIDFFTSHFNEILLYIGILEKRRNVDFIIQLLNILKTKNNKSIGLIIVGDGPERIKIEKLINRFKLEDSVLLIERVQNNQLWYIYKSADVFLLPSSYEIYGMVVLEALYYGVPVISTTTAGPMDIIKSNVLGTCLPMDANLWLKSIIELIENKTVNNKAIRTNYIKEKYNWESIAKKYIDLVSHSK